MKSQRIIKLLQEKIDLERKKKVIQAEINEKRRKLYAKYKNPLKSLNSQIDSKGIEIFKMLEE